MFLAGADYGQFGSDAPRSGEQDVAGAARDVGDAQVQQGLFRVGVLELACDEVVERVLDEGVGPGRPGCSGSR